MSSAEPPLPRLRTLLTSFAQQEQLAETVSAQALALAALPDTTDAAAIDGDDMMEDTMLVTKKLAEASAILRMRQRELSGWLERVAADARTQREQLVVERQALLASMSSADSQRGALSALALELMATQRQVMGRLDERGDEPDGPPAADSTSQRVDGGGDGDVAGRDGDVVRLNVGGQIFCTTLSTLRSEESMLSAMFSGRFDVRKDADGAVFIDRDGTHFRHILNHLRGTELHLGRDLRMHLALLDEADFYQVVGLQEMLRAELSRLEDKGEKLKQISIDSAIEHTRGVFDDLLGALYAEVESQAARGKRVVVIGFLQEKLVKGVRYRSQESDFWDAKLLMPRYHRFLSSIPNQQLLCDRLAEQGLKAQVKPLSVNVPVGDEATAVQWVATTTLLLTLTIWEPTQVGIGGHVSNASFSGAAGPLGAHASPLREPTLLRSSSDVRSTDELSVVSSESADVPQLSTVHRRTLNTAWGRPSEHAAAG